jgi:hypothetical protein
MKKSVVILLLMIATSVHAQKFTFGVELGYGFYNMQSLREKQRIELTYNIPYKVVQDFPLTPYVNVFGRIRIHDALSTGISAGYMRTGSRATYSDYSGTAHRDIIVSGFQISCSNIIKLYKLKEYTFNVRLNVGSVFNYVSFKNSITLNSPSGETVSKSKLKSTNAFGSLGGDITREIGNFTVAILAQYEHHSAGEMKLVSYDSVGYKPAPDFRVEWDGLRVGIAGSIKF